VKFVCLNKIVIPARPLSAPGTLTAVFRKRFLEASVSISSSLIAAASSPGLPRLMLGIVLELRITSLPNTFKR